MTDEAAAARGTPGPAGGPDPADNPGPSQGTLGTPDPGAAGPERAAPQDAPPPGTGWPTPPGAPPPPGAGAPPPPGAGAPPPPGAGAPPPPGAPPPGAGGPPPEFGFAYRYGLVRPTEGRYLAGVCAALGRATNSDPILWRVLLAVLGFFGGIGLLVYLAAWLIIPSEGDTASPVESMLGRGRSSMSPVTVLVLGIVAAVMFGFIVTDTYRAVLLGAAVLIGGALLLNRDRNRNQPYWQPDAGPPPPGQPYPGPGQQHPGPGQQHPGPGQQYPGPGQQYPGPGQQYPGPGQQYPGPGQQYPGPGQQYPGPGQQYPGPGQAVPPPAAPGHPGWYPPQPTAAPGHLGGPATAPSAPPPAPAWPASSPSVAVPTGHHPAAVPPVPPLPPGGYRAPFAPHGPYATRPAPVPPPPPPTKTKPPKRPRERSALGPATFSLIFVAIGLVAILDLTNAIPVQPSTYFAAVLVTIALGLLVGAWFGRARWLIALGLVAACALGISTVAESYTRLRGEENVFWTPASYDVMADRYETRLGNATLDLTRIDFIDRDARVSVDVSLGEVRVILPPTVDLTVRLDVNAGDALIMDRRYSNFDGSQRVVTDLGEDGPGGGKLLLDLTVNAASAEVTR